MNEGVARLLGRQEGVATLAQLAGRGHTESRVRAEVHARRWQRIGFRCIVAHNHVPTRRQIMWAAVLDPAGPTALAGLTSLETVGFKFFGAEMDQIHVVVRRGARYHPLPGVRIHESRRFDPSRVVHDAGPPRLPTARSVLDAAAWQPYQRYAAALLAAAVQQRLCSAADLSRELPHVGRIRHKQMMRLTILDIGGGAEALSEIDIGAVCGRHHLVPPARQRFRRDRQGRKRYLDCEWDLPEGGIVVLEVDGAHHLLVEHWEADIKRERDIVISGRRVLRATANEARNEQARLARDLRAAGVPTELSGGGVALAT